MTKLELPGESEWRSEPWCLDAEYAYGVFNGKNHDDALRLFEEHSLGRQEDVMFMPVACFPFYFNVYMDYLLSSESIGDSDGASCFLSLVDSKKKVIQQQPQWLFAKTVETLDHIAQNQDYFDADEDIYGSFEKKSSESKRRLLL